MRASSAATAWLSADVDTPSSVAAARKLRWRATASTASSSPKPDVFIIPNLLNEIMPDYTASQRNDVGLSCSFNNFLGGAFMQKSTRFISTARSSRRTATNCFDLFNPATEQVIGRCVSPMRKTHATRSPPRNARFRRFPAPARASASSMLKRMHAAVVAKEDELYEAITEEYGAPVSRGRWMAQHASGRATRSGEGLADLRFTRRAGTAEVVMQPLGVAGLITPWNSDAGFICGKLAAAIGCGLHGRHQAERNERDPDTHHHRSAARSGLARGRVQHRHGPGRNGRGGDQLAPRCREDVIHRLDGRRQDDSARWLPIP